MALDLTSEQTNDAKILYLTDASTWGSDSIPAFATFKANMVSAELEISYKSTDYPDGTDSVTVDISQIFTDATDETDLIYNIVFPIPSSLDGTETGISQLPDGVWTINYILTDNSDTYEVTLEFLLDEIIKADVYKEVAKIPLKYLCANHYYTKQIDDILLISGLYYSLQANAYIAKQDYIIEILDTLERQLN